MDSCQHHPRIPAVNLQIILYVSAGDIECCEYYVNDSLSELLVTRALYQERKLRLVLDHSLTPLGDRLWLRHE